MTPPTVSLLIQGLGGLFLASVCTVLYSHRRRSYFLSWTLSWLCFSLWFLLGCVLHHVRQTNRLLGGASLVCCGWHLALWVVGMLQFYQAKERTGGEQSPASQEGIPAVERSRVPLWAILLVTAVFAVLLSRTLDW